MSVSENSYELPDALRSPRFIKSPPDKEETQTTSTSQSLIRQKGGIGTGPNQTISISEQRRPSFKDAELLHQFGFRFTEVLSNELFNMQKGHSKPIHKFFTITMQNNQPTVTLKQQMKAFRHCIYTLNPCFNSMIFFAQC